MKVLISILSAGDAADAWSNDQFYEIEDDPQEVQAVIDDPAAPEDDTEVAEISEADLADYKLTMEKFKKWQERLATWNWPK